MPTTETITPPALAKRYGISVEKVLTWIRAGELAAINIATRLGGRPRYAIAPEAIEVFESRRKARPAPLPAARPREPTAYGHIKFV